MKPHQKYSYKTVLFALCILLLLLPLTLMLCGFLLPPQYEETFLGEMKYKFQRLRTTEGKRIVFLGGSSVPFALDSALIESHVKDYKIVDFGMYANLGTVIMLDWAMAEIHEGDIFILMPEQNSQTLSCFFSGESIWQAADGAPELLTFLSPKRIEKLLAAFPVFAGKKLNYTFTGSPVPDGIYARSSFNSFGDISYPKRNSNIMAGGFNPNDLICFSSEIISTDFIEEMNNFATYAQEKGASVFYHFPPMNQKALSTDTDIVSIDAYYNFLQEQLSFPILGNPHSCIMESDWFYDTNFHLNSSGSIVFTKKLIENLKLLFQDTSITAITLPPMPKGERITTATDNSCVDCFTYKELADGWEVTGLTEKGRNSAELILPAFYMDKPILSISTTLFHGNTMLKTLTVQDNIGTLPDEMFKNCSSFHSLILTAKDPSSYMIGKSLMQGADFLIYVPESTYDAYRRHYSWQIYSSFLTYEGN